MTSVKPEDPETPVEPSAPGLTVKKTLLFTEEDWERIQQSAQRLAADTHSEADVPGFVRGTLRKRCDEVLGAAA
jgi:hypothetical protein